MTLKLAIFDVDGTLIDSRKIIHRAAEVTFAKLDLPIPTYDDVRQVVGLSLSEALGRLAPAAQGSALDELTVAYQKAFGEFRHDPEFIEPQYDGANGILDQLEKDGWLLAMATGKSRRGVEEILDMHNWRSRFMVTRCADDGPGKPHPHMVLDCLKHTGVDTADAVMIGDTTFDMQMAQAAKVPNIAVTWGFHTEPELVATNPDHIAHTFTDLAGILSKRMAA